MTFNRYVGQFAYPTTDEDAILDPAGDTLRLLMKAAIIDGLDSWWQTHGNIPGTGNSPVGESLTAEPTPALLTTTPVTWPALFVYRDGEASFEWFTRGKKQLRQRWFIEWIVGPAEPGTQRRLSGALRYVAGQIAEVIRLGGHPAYALDEGDLYPAQTLYLDPADGGCGFTSAEIPSDQPIAIGAAQFSEGGPTYHGVRVPLVTLELDGATSVIGDASEHVGATFALGGDSDGDFAQDIEDTSDALVEIDSDID